MNLKWLKLSNFCSIFVCKHPHFISRKEQCKKGDNRLSWWAIIWRGKGGEHSDVFSFFCSYFGQHLNKKVKQFEAPWKARSKVLIYDWTRLTLDTTWQKFCLVDWPLVWYVLFDTNTQVHGIAHRNMMRGNARNADLMSTNDETRLFSHKLN